MHKLQGPYALARRNQRVIGILNRRQTYSTLLHRIFLYFHLYVGYIDGNFRIVESCAICIVELNCSFKFGIHVIEILIYKKQNEQQLQLDMLITCQAQIKKPYFRLRECLIILALFTNITANSQTISINQLPVMQDTKDILKSPHTVLLDIPPRFQWQNDNGFCGETSIQSCGLYYGNYLSQVQVRKTAGSEVLIGQNAEKAIQKLGFAKQSWNSESAQPQYKSYLQWIKKNILNGYPVIVTGYEPEGNNKQYDHIYLAVGVYSTNYEQFNQNDVLIYADLFDENYTQTAFGKIWDTRSMQGNGKHLDFAIPKQVNYGIAIKGLLDKDSIFLPVRISLDENSEPNVSLGEEAAQFQLKVRVSKLTPGVKYAVLRYQSYKDLPTDSIDSGKAQKVIKFVANGTIYDFVDVCDSDATVFYRCVQEKHLK